MDLTVAGIGSAVVRELRCAGYMESTVGQYEKSIRALARFAGECGEVDYTLALGARFASMTVSPRTGQFSAQRRFDYGRLVGVFDTYVSTGRVDLCCRKRGGGGPRPCCEEFVWLSAAWEADMDERGLAPATREAYGRVSRGYLVFLEGRGIERLGDADGASVLGFLESLSPRWAVSSLFWVVSDFRPFLRFTGRVDLLDAVGMAHVRRYHKILPVLGDDEQRRVVEFCASGPVSMRDAAITLLVLSTGLRACDIVALRLADIDWRARTVGLVQQKTRKPLRLPLGDLLLEKLAGYVLDERPGSSDDHVFLRVKAPHAGLSGHASVHRVTAGVFRKAGVVGVVGGPRFLRHNAASRLLACAVPLETIAAVLGHSDPQSTDVYLSTGRDRLLDCVLALPEAVRS